MNGSIWMIEMIVCSADFEQLCTHGVYVSTVCLLNSRSFISISSQHFEIIQSIANAMHSFFLCQTRKHKHALSMSYFILNEEALFSLKYEKMCPIFMQNHYLRLWKVPYAACLFSALKVYQWKMYALKL